jgi:hypothetical protein
MQKCPCCGEQKVINYSSGLRVGAGICSSCGNMEHLRGSRPWYVDTRPVPKYVSDFVSARGKYLYVHNVFNEAEKSKIESEYLRSLSNVLQLYVVMSVKGANHTALGAFDTSNDAIAFTSAKLVQGSSLSGENMWQLPTGEFIYIWSLN